MRFNFEMIYDSNNDDNDEVESIAGEWSLVKQEIKEVNELLRDAIL